MLDGDLTLVHCLDLVINRSNQDRSLRSFGAIPAAGKKSVVVRLIVGNWRGDVQGLYLGV